MKQMATVRKRGNTYQIRVSAGYDSKGNQIIKSKTWKPSPTMTERQIKKELETQTVLFEQQVQNGQFLDGNITVSEFLLSSVLSKIEDEEDYILGEQRMLDSDNKPNGSIRELAEKYGIDYDSL